MSSSKIFSASGRLESLQQQLFSPPIMAATEVKKLGVVGAGQMVDIPKASRGARLIYRD